MGAACRVAADHARGSQSRRGGWLTSESKAGKSDLFCILNRPRTWTQEAATSQLRNTLGCSDSILRACLTVP